VELGPARGALDGVAGADVSGWEGAGALIGLAAVAGLPARPGSARPSSGSSATINREPPERINGPMTVPVRLSIG